MAHVAAGFSAPVARWVTTNLRPTPGTHSLRWTFDLDGIAEMYNSYEISSLWGLLEAPPQGLAVDFVRAERSSFRWEGGIADNIQELGHRVHTLKDAGHWVHTDNPGIQPLQVQHGGAVLGSGVWAASHAAWQHSICLVRQGCQVHMLVCRITTTLCFHLWPVRML